MHNNMNYFDRMKRKWTQFKMGMGLSKGDINGQAHIDNNKEKNQIINEKKDLEEKKNINEINEKDKNYKKENLNFLIKSDFLSTKHPIGLADYDIYAPKKIEEEEMKIEIDDDEEIITDYFKGDSNKNNDNIMNNGEDINYNKNEGEFGTHKKNSSKFNRNCRDFDSNYIVKIFFIFLFKIINQSPQLVLLIILITHLFKHEFVI